MNEIKDWSAARLVPTSMTISNNTIGQNLFDNPIATTTTNGLSFTLNSASISDSFYKDVLGIEAIKAENRYAKGVSTVKNNELKILNYSFNNGKTTITWNDGTNTTCYTKPDKADAYTGFMIALAKKFMGNKNKATNLADYWINKLPAQKKKEEEKKLKTEAEKKRIEEKKRQRREEYRLRIAAIQRKEAYDAAVLAHEKYGVPLNFKED